MSRRWERGTRLYLLYALAFAGASVWLADLLHHRVLFLDQWRINYYFFTRPLWEAIWRDSAGHRIAVPNLLVYAGNAFFAGDNEFLVVLALALFAASAWMLCSAIRRWEGCDAGVKRLSMGMVLVTLFWFGNQITLVWGAAGVQTSLPIAGTLGALVATKNAAVARHRVAWAWTALAVLLAAITTYSSGTGPPVWTALIVVSLLDRSRWRSALFALLGAAAISFYALAGPGSIATDLTTVEGASPLGAAASTLVLLGAFPAHLLAFAVAPGSPVTFVLASCCGLAGLLFAAWATVVLGFRRRPLERSAVVLLGCVGYAVVVVGVTGVVRSAAFEVSNSLAPRYAVWSSLFWGGLFSLLPPLIARGEPRWGGPRARRAVASAAAALAVLAWPSHRQWIGVVAERTLRNEETALSLVVGVMDPEPQRWHLYKNLDRVRVTEAELRRRRWNLFRHDWAHWAGTSLLDHGLEASETERVVGESSLVPISSSAPQAGWRAEGWAWDTRKGRPPSLVVLVDSAGVVRGLGRFTRDPSGEGRAWVPVQGPLVRALGLVHPLLPAALGHGAGWFGYVQGGTEVRGLRALAVLDDGRSVARLDAAAP